MVRAYWFGARQVQLFAGDESVVFLAVAVAAVAFTRRWGVVAAVVAVGVVGAARSSTRTRRGVVIGTGLLAVALVLTMLNSQRAWNANIPRRTGPFTGWATVVDDPQPYRGTTRIVLSVDGQRFEYWARGRAGQQRIRRWSAGDSVRIAALRSPLKPQRRSRVAWQHVVGTVELDWVGDWAPATGLAGAANRIRAVLDDGSSVLRSDHAALFRGLVIGDDADEPPEMLDRFRTSGLSHLTAVSGQNVVFVLAAAGPILRRLRPWPRWALTLGLIGWFVMLTRFEPSIVRAGAMAAISATGFALGSPRSPIRILALAVVVLLAVDPLLVYSVGFILSVGATAGVAAVGPWLSARLPGPGWLVEPVAVTLGAQIGVAVPSLVVFGRLPLVSIPANLMAVPAAGFVMLYGLPAGVVAGAVPAVGPVVMFPCRVGVTWVDAVATVAAAAEPAPVVAWFGWAVVAVLTAVGIAIRRTRGNGYRSADDRVR